MTVSASRSERRTLIQSRAAALVGPQAAVVVTPTAAPADNSDLAATTVVELWLYGVVGGYWYGFGSESVAAALRGLDVDEITVRLHSPGGSITEGIAISNLLRNHTARCTVVVDGIAASIASVIALAGDEIVMSPGSQMMLHDPWMVTVGNAAELRADSTWLDQQAANLAGVYAHRGTGATAAQWREVMTANEGRGTWYTAAEAVAAGLADRVGTVTAANPPPAPPTVETSDLDAEEIEARAAWDLDVLIHPAIRPIWAHEQRPAADVVASLTPDPPTASADGSTPAQGTETAVAFTPTQRLTMCQELGIAEDADEATIVAALSEALAEQAETPDTGTNPSPVPEGMSLVETEVLDQLRAGASAGQAAREQQLAEHRDRTIDAAVASGRIAPARRDHWAAAWAADPAGTESTIAQLAPGLIPVTELGHAGGDPNASSVTDDSWFPGYTTPSSKEN